MDATLSLHRVASVLDRTFERLIDMDDVPNKSPDERRNRFLSRSLAAFCVLSLAKADPESAASSVTDGYDDQGLDAIYFDNTDDSLYLVQAKWRNNAKGTVEVGDCSKFIDGVEALISGDFSRFNEKIKSREQELRGVLYRSDVRVVLIVAYTSPNSLPDPVEHLIRSLLTHQNNVGDTEIFTLEALDLKRIYSYLAGPSAGRDIKVQIALTEWGTIDVPYRAYYGQVKIAEVADWAKFGKALLDRNLRFYRGSTEVNDAMEETLTKTPERFWYFNNGIIILCERVAKTVLNGDARNYGVFDCEGVSVVNGAQTVGVIWELARRDQATVKLSNAKVNLRLISLKQCPQGFDADVTRATNTQNRIQHRDFAALDAIQHQLAREMALDGRRYAFKSGDPDPKGDEGCNIEEATIALACALADVSMAVQAKREVGVLWRDVTKPPYTTLFNERVSARDVWRAVQISRAVSEELDVLGRSEYPRADLLAVHGNRFILYRVFQDPEIKGFRDPMASESKLLTTARSATRDAFADTARHVQEKHANAYLANLFKNAQKCRSLLMTDSNVPAVGEHMGTLFPMD